MVHLIKKHFLLAGLALGGLWGTGIVGRDSEARADAAATIIGVDVDDDDVDGVADGKQLAVPVGRELLEIALPDPGARPNVAAPPPETGIRFVSDGKALVPGETLPRGAKTLYLQATRPGRLSVDVLGQTHSLGALEVLAIDGSGAPIDLVSSHASMQRTPPDRVPDPPGVSQDPDALRFIVRASADDLPTTLHISSRAESGELIDVLRDLPLEAAACPPGGDATLHCARTTLLRAVADDIDRSHPLVRDRSIKTMLGGLLSVLAPDGTELSGIRVGGPRVTELGPIRRYRATLRIHLMRVRAGGPPPVGANDEEAIEIARNEVRRTNELWGACGIGFGAAEDVEITVRDAPASHLVAVGCDYGLPASGGKVQLNIDGRDIAVSIPVGAKPNAAARALAAEIAKFGWAAEVSDNRPIWAGAFGASDVSVRRRDGQLATVRPVKGQPVSDDATLGVCIGEVDLSNGLHHFADADAIAGTVEERALLKALDDGDPSTVEVIFVPSFKGGGRIGESFIYADGGAIRNVVIEDRAGIRADRASFALAHELGHVLLDEPGHPDDFGVDTPTRLMDADAADGSAYGPRRLLVEECVRAIRQSGPASPSAILRPWPLLPVAGP